MRGRLDLLRQQTCITNTSHCPDPEVKVQASQRRQKIAYDKHAKQREFTVGQAVWVKGQNHQQNWLPGVIVKQRNSVSYTVNVSEQLWHRHIDHLREREQDEAHVQGAEDAEYFPNRQPGSADDQDIITDENAPNLRHDNSQYIMLPLKRIRQHCLGSWGSGTYFAVNASYSHNYAFKKREGGKVVFQMLLAFVLTGMSYYSPPDPSLRRPPPVRQSGPFEDQLYDSVQGNTGNTDVYVVYDHEKAYPAYILTYSMDPCACAHCRGHAPSRGRRGRGRPRKK